MLDPANLSELLRQGDVRAMNNVALLWAKGHDGKQSYDEAMHWWKEAAKRGYTVAMNNIGLLYAKGDGVEQDYKQAFDWWHQSAFLGNAWAMNSVGDLYENGLGIGKDLGMAMTWYQSAAEQGDPMAMYNVGLLYEAGKGVDRDSAKRCRGSATLGRQRLCVGDAQHWRHVCGRPWTSPPIRWRRMRGTASPTCATRRRTRWRQQRTRQTWKNSRAA